MGLEKVRPVRRTSDDSERLSSEQHTPPPFTKPFLTQQNASTSQPSAPVVPDYLALFERQFSSPTEVNDEPDADAVQAEEKSEAFPTLNAVAETDDRSETDAANEALSSPQPSTISDAERMPDSEQTAPSLDENALSSAAVGSIIRLPLYEIIPDPMQPRPLIPLPLDFESEAQAAFSEYDPFRIIAGLVAIAENPTESVVDIMPAEAAFAQRILEQIKELAENIHAIGLIHPIHVRPLETTNPELPPHFMIVSGERRYWAYVYLAWEHMRRNPHDSENPYAAIPAVVQIIDESQTAIYQWHENTMRRDMPFALIIRACLLAYDQAYEELRQAQGLGLSLSTQQHQMLHQQAVQRACENLHAQAGLRLDRRTFKAYLGYAKRINPELYDKLGMIHAPASVVRKLCAVPLEHQHAALDAYLTGGRIEDFYAPSSSNKTNANAWHRRIRDALRAWEAIVNELDASRLSESEKRQLNETLAALEQTVQRARQALNA